MTIGSVGPGTDIVISADRLAEATRHFDEARGLSHEKLAAFPRFVERTDLGRFLVRYEIFKKVTGVQGSIVECGVFDGAGLFTFAQLSALLEPLNHRRRVIGFDTFSGFPGVAEVDTAGGSAKLRPGGYRGSTAEELDASIEMYNEGRALSQIPKVELVKGDFLETGARYLEANQHLVVALLYLDFDLYEPTRRALELFLPRMPTGAVVAFDEVHVAEAPGETMAVLEAVGIRSLRLERTPLSSICWAVLDPAVRPL